MLKTVLVIAMLGLSIVAVGTVAITGQAQAASRGGSTGGNRSGGQA